jgi:hypothetical protein
MSLAARATAVFRVGSDRPVAYLTVIIGMTVSCALVFDGQNLGLPLSLENVIDDDINDNE